MFISAEAFFQDETANNTRVLRRAETELPAEFVRRYKKNVVKITPMKSGYLRRSIITQALGNTANISWRAPHAGAQNEGGHRVNAKRVVNIDGNFVTLQPGYYRYRNYTTPGTGPNFATKAFMATQDEMPAVYRQMGLTE